MNSKPFKSTAFSIAIYAAIALAAIKIIASVFTSPLLAYANSYDFVRQSSCAGIWQSYPDMPDAISNPEAPVNSLIFNGKKHRSVCMKSTDNLFIQITKKLHTKGDTIDFREISFWKIALTFLFLFLLLAKTVDPAHKLVFSLTFLLVFGDLANLLYANTLYLEFSVIAGLFFALLTTILLLSTKQKNTGLIVLTTLSLIWIGFSKQQYMPLAVVLGMLCGAALVLRHRDRRLGIAFIVMAALTPFIYAKINKIGSGHMKQVSFANKTDSFLGAILPEAIDKEAALLRLGLPAGCMQAIGKNWYMPGVMENHPCPEILHVSRAKLAGIFISEPATFFEPIRKATLGLFPFYPDYLGHLESPKDSDSQRYLLLRKTSLSYALAQLPQKNLPKFVLGSMAFGIIACAAICASARTHPRVQPLLWMVMLGSMVAIYSIVSSVFGDGYIEMQKHAVGFLIGIAFQVVAITCLLAGGLLSITLRKTGGSQAPD